MRIRDELSSHQFINNGVLQEEVWSASLFLLPIDDIPLTQRFSLTITASLSNPRTLKEQQVFSNYFYACF